MNASFTPPTQAEKTHLPYFDKAVGRPQGERANSLLLKITEEEGCTVKV